MTETRNVDYFPIWQCPKCGRHNRQGDNRCQNRVYESRPQVRMLEPGEDYRQVLTEENFKAGTIAYQCDYTKPCRVCGKPSTSIYVDGSLCTEHAKVPETYHAELIEELRPKPLYTNPVPQDYAQPVEDTGSLQMTSLNGLLRGLQERDIVYDVRKSVGPEGEECVCVRVNLDDLGETRRRIALMWKDKKFWIGLDAIENAGIQSVGFAEAKSRMGWDIKPRVPRAKIERAKSEPKLKDTMR